MKFSSFGRRWKEHEKLQNKVMDHLEENGIEFARYGVESGSTEKIIDSLRDCKNKCAFFVRYMPDMLVVVDNKAYLCEIKSRNPNQSNFSVELGSYEMGIFLHSNGIETFYVFSDLKSCWVSELEFESIWIPSNRWGKKYFNEIQAGYPKKNLVYRPVKGSGTPFILVDRDLSALQHLNEFVAEPRRR